ncbi:MAG: hypothetical protein ACREMW_02310 [Gemmatimonadales bacterium]
MSNATMLRIALPLTVVIPCAMAAQVPAELANAIRTRDRAELASDPVTWDRLTGDDFTIVLADGTLMTKAQQLAQLKNQGRVRCEACVLRPVFYIDGMPVSEGVELLQPLPRAEVRVSGYPEEQIARHGSVFVRRFHRAGNWILEIWAKDHREWRVQMAQITSARS